MTVSEGYNVKVEARRFSDVHTLRLPVMLHSGLILISAPSLRAVQSKGTDVSLVQTTPQFLKPSGRTMTPAR
jgi:hypothetical protein